MRAYLLLLLIFIAACHSPTKKKVAAAVKSTPVITDQLLTFNAIKNTVAVEQNKLYKIQGTFNTYKAYLKELSDTEPASIPRALTYIKTCLPTDLPERDSVVLLYNQKFFTITNKLSDLLETKYAVVAHKWEADTNAIEAKTFLQNLKQCGIGLYMTEGIGYLDVLPNHFYDNFKNRVSPGVKQYLTIRKVELAQGFSEDAGLLISFKQLYERVKTWENFLKNFPNTVYENEARNYYTNYLETLLTGMDNSRVFDIETNTLDPEVKAIYEKAMIEDTDKLSGKIIEQYYQFLARHEFKDNDSVTIFLKKNNLTTMLAVQPDTR